MAASRYDMARFGAEVSRVAAPVGFDDYCGASSDKMAPVIRQLYEQMPEAEMGDFDGCVRDVGGVFNNYAVVQGVNQVIPVDVYVPGCPPRPEALLYALMQLQKKIDAERGSFRKAINLSS